MIGNIIIRPFLTEKTLTLATKGWYTFVVEIFANKYTVAHAIEELYGVKVIDVRMIRMPGKTKHVGKSRVTVEAKEWKKAMVELQKGQSIDAFQLTKEKTT